jgi:spore coat polysaccharide biosynthesis predicted glycosyltransferase SpsG
MSPPAIVFRADASHDLGLGHVARLCAVIEELQAAGGAAIAMLGGDASVAAWARSQGVDVVPPPARARAGQAPQAWSTDELFAAAARPGVRAVVIDGPPLVAALAPRLIARGIPTVVIDDGGDLPLAVDAAVNHNFHAPALAAGYPAARRRLLGRDYLMLRRAVRRHPRGASRAGRPPAGPRLRVVVTFGGSDPVGATARTLRLVPADPPVELAVVAGPGFRDHAGLHAAAAAAVAAGHTVELLRAPDLAGLVIGADAAICSAGGTLGELAYLGCPALAFAIVPDQLAGARAQRSAGVIAGGGSWAELDDGAVRGELAGFLAGHRERADLRERALATADGGGARRIVAEAFGLR